MHLPKNKFLLSAIASALLLNACGGGGSGGSSAATSTRVSGAVVDGYIEGAMVCLDINASQTCDPTEPSSTTDKDGKYSLSLDGISAKQLKTLQILAVVPDTAKDSDDAGKTLAAAGKKGFALMVPAVDASGKTHTTDTLITPLTTQVSGEVLRGATVSEAEALVKSNLSLPANTNLYQDTTKLAKTDALRLQTQVLAIASGLLANGASGCATQLAILDYLQANIEKLLKSVQTNSSESTLAEKVQTALDSLNGMTDEKQIAAAQCNAKPVAASKDLVIDLYGPDNLDSSQDARYHYDHNANGRYTSEVKRINGSAWEDDTEEALWLNERGEWVQRSNTGSYTVSDDGVFSIKEDIGLEAKAQFSSEDISGRKMTEFGDLNNYSSTLGNTTFPAGSTLILVRERNLTEAFYAEGGRPNCDNSTCSSLTDFLDAYAKDATNSKDVETFEYEDVIYSFDKTGSSAKGGNISFWDGSGQKVGSSSYGIRKVSGVDVLVANVCFDRKDCWDLPAFVMKDGVVHNGDYESTSLSYEQKLNKAATNAVLKAFNKPAVVD